MRKIIFICDRCKQEGEFIAMNQSYPIPREFDKPTYLSGYGELCPQCTLDISKILHDNNGFLPKL
jgi:hypothetical protein